MSSYIHPAFLHRSCQNPFQWLRSSEPLAFPLLLHIVPQSFLRFLPLKRNKKWCLPVRNTRRYLLVHPKKQFRIMQHKRRNLRIQYKRRFTRIQHRKRIRLLYRRQTRLLPSMKGQYRRTMRRQHRKTMKGQHKKIMKGQHKKRKHNPQDQNDGPIRLPQRSPTRTTSMPLRPSPPRATGLPLLRHRREVFPRR